jgi:aminoglycoside phosphotransferase (APT) family kinase protein
VTLDEMAEALARFFDDTFSRAGHTVRDLGRLSGGASRETFAFDLSRPDRPDDPWPLILQRVRAGALSASFTMDGEAALLRAAAAQGVPVAPAVASSDDSSLIGAPFLVMERVDGETIGRKLLRDDEFATARTVLVAQSAAALARIHAVPVDAAPHLRADDPVAQLRGLLDMLGEPHPAFELAFRWLADERPPPAATRTTVVHGDFRLGNLMVGPDGLVAVLDWELAHLGDPMEDLGWFCVRAWRFGSPLPVAGMGTYEELAAAYAEAAGVEVSADAIRWWEVLGTLRWGIICILQASGHLSGASRSVELAAIGRRTVENEYDVLRLLGADSLLTTADTAVGAASAYDTGPHDAPSAPQLVEAVREYLERDVLGATTGRVQFHARVAINVLGMVERELVSGAAIAAAHRARLEALGFADDHALAAAIRSGDLGGRGDEVTAAVYASVLDKLAVANPDYA